MSKRRSSRKPSRDRRSKRQQDAPRRRDERSGQSQPADRLAEPRPAVGQGLIAGNWRTIAAAAVIILAGAISYSNSFGGTYIFDDTTSIPKNPYIRSLWPIWDAMKGPSQQTVDGRPILCLSLAINYKISGLDVWSYHLVNLLIHLGCGLLLYGIVRRTLLTEKLAGTFGRAAWPLALVVAVIWLVHPLNTGSVTYMIQRAESLMGLFYLATLYLAIRGYTSPGDGGSRRRWRRAGSAWAARRSCSPHRLWCCCTT